MKIKILLFQLICFVVSNFSQTPIEEITENYFVKNEWESFFNKANVTGTFVLYNLTKDSCLVYNSDRAETQYLPASTFKIPNSLISLETKVINDENEIIKWDGEKRFIDNWNQDHNLKSGIKYSVVWFYQELARRIGFEKMQEFVTKINYGNKKLGDKIDTFWLEGDLRINAVEQILFLNKFIKNELPFSKRNMEIVKNILLVDSTDAYKLYAKTGWSARVEKDKQIGWYVGFVETKNDTWIFAINIDINDEKDLPQRINITREILKSEGIIK
ncbi:MAG: class D beta-lactamase [Ignavibacteriae bacterium]|nr:class D beta-lactamase [Ignavibacteriota bacterium]